jgi:hypothetical protein
LAKKKTKQLDLVGLAEVAEMLNIRRGSVASRRETHFDTFPAPVAELACGPIWLRSQLVEYLALEKELGALARALAGCGRSTPARCPSGGRRAANSVRRTRASRSAAAAPGAPLVPGPNNVFLPDWEIEALRRRDLPSWGSLKKSAPVPAAVLVRGRSPR